MFYRQLTDLISIRLSIPQFAEEVFALVDRNRDFLRQWMPWIDTTVSVQQPREFLQLQTELFSKGEALHATIFYGDEIAGGVGYNGFDHVNGVAIIGYWLGEEFTGKGIMTAAVRDLIGIGRKYYSLKRIEIHCATDNLPSRAIPERLGFTYVRTDEQASEVNGRWDDHAIYVLVLE